MRTDRPISFWSWTLPILCALWMHIASPSRPSLSSRKFETSAIQSLLRTCVVSRICLTVRSALSSLSLVAFTSSKQENMVSSLLSRFRSLNFSSDNILFASSGDSAIPDELTDSPEVRWRFIAGRNPNPLLPCPPREAALLVHWPCLPTATFQSLRVDIFWITGLFDSLLHEI